MSLWRNKCQAPKHALGERQARMLEVLRDHGPLVVDALPGAMVNLAITGSFAAQVRPVGPLTGGQVRV